MKRKAIYITLFILVMLIFIYLAEVEFLVSEEKILAYEDYQHEVWGDFSKNQQDSLMCTYLGFGGLRDISYWYSPNDILGRHACPKIYKQ